MRCVTKCKAWVDAFESSFSLSANFIIPVGYVSGSDEGSSHENKL